MAVKTGYSRGSGSQGTATASAPQVSREEVAVVAYELFEKRGRIPGYDVEDWLEAERIVRTRRGRSSR
jgi:hypothetical protein